MFKEITLDTLQKQFGYTNLSDLLVRRAGVWDTVFGNISETFRKEILDYNTCIPDALDYFWGKLFKISRTFTGKDGHPLVLDDDAFREVIKIRAFNTTWQGDLYSMNQFLRDIFGARGDAYLIDNLDMTNQLYIFGFELEDWEQYIFANYDILPRPAGIGTKILNIDRAHLFGFYGTEFQPFNQGTLWGGAF